MTKAGQRCMMVPLPKPSIRLLSLFFFFFLIKIQIIEIPWKRVLSRSVSIETFPGRQARDSVYVY